MWKCPTFDDDHKNPPLLPKTLQSQQLPSSSFSPLKTLSKVRDFLSSGRLCYITPKKNTKPFRISGALKLFFKFCTFTVTVYRQKGKEEEECSCVIELSRTAGCIIAFSQFKESFLKFVEEELQHPTVIFFSYTPPEALESTPRNEKKVGLMSDYVDSTTNHVRALLMAGQKTDQEEACHSLLTLLSAHPSPRLICRVNKELDLLAWFQGDKSPLRTDGENDTDDEVEKLQNLAVNLLFTLLAHSGAECAGSTGEVLSKLEAIISSTSLIFSFYLHDTIVMTRRCIKLIADLLPKKEAQKKRVCQQLLARPFPFSLFVPPVQDTPVLY